MSSLSVLPSSDHVIQGVETARMTEIAQGATHSATHDLSHVAHEDALDTHDNTHNTLNISDAHAANLFSTSTNTAHAQHWPPWSSLQRSSGPKCPKAAPLLSKSRPHFGIFVDSHSEDGGDAIIENKAMGCLALRVLRNNLNIVRPQPLRRRVHPPLQISCEDWQKQQGKHGPSRRSGIPHCANAGFYTSSLERSKH
ncbi:hypothetical protein OPT61_g2599 [Boeremia exigua]|uniref:Uncharacterized protein n=1 Tax=Boeremia exigua TaxID=749465 RepID=A0ACC2IKZ9_9PLEO|nr:hypothetical protein OPT61_g2599 [Boeremia exigua]